MGMGGLYKLISYMQKYLYIIVLSLVAIVDAAYLSYQAYIIRFVENGNASSFCDLTQSVSCTNVLQSPYSQIFGVSFPWVALVVYPVILALAYFGYKNKNIFQAKVIQVLSFCGMFFNFYIIYLETFYIFSFCILCLLCTAIITTIFILSSMVMRD
jgi:uncharacterized membrane protein